MCGTLGVLVISQICSLDFFGVVIALISIKIEMIMFEKYGKKTEINTRYEMREREWENCRKTVYQKHKREGEKLFREGYCYFSNCIIVEVVANFSLWGLPGTVDFLLSK